MKVELSGGFEAEIRENLTGGDRRAVNKAIVITVAEDGSRLVCADMQDSVKTALLRRLITSWTIPNLPIPAEATDEDGGPDGVLDGLPLEDLEALDKAVQPAYDRIMETGRAPAPNRDAAAKKRARNRVIQGAAEK